MGGPVAYPTAFAVAFSAATRSVKSEIHLCFEFLGYATPTPALVPSPRLGAACTDRVTVLYPTTNASATPASPQPRAAVARFQSDAALLGEPVAVTMVPLAVLVGVDVDLENT